MPGLCVIEYPMELSQLLACVLINVYLDYKHIVYWDTVFLKLSPFYCVCSFYSFSCYYTL